MNDLLGNVRAVDEVQVDLESGRAGGPSTSDGESMMVRFYESVAEVKANLVEIKGMQDEIRDMNETGKTLIKSKDVEKHREDMQVNLGGSEKHASALLRARCHCMDDGHAWRA